MTTKETIKSKTSYEKESILEYNTLMYDNRIDSHHIQCQNSLLLRYRIAVINQDVSDNIKSTDLKQYLVLDDLQIRLKQTRYHRLQYYFSHLQSGHQLTT